MSQVLEFFKANLNKRTSENGPMSTGKWLDGLLIAAEEGSLTVEYQLRPEMLNPGGILHGGIAATMMDEVMGMTVFSLGRKEFYATINMTVDYLRPARINDKVIAKAIIVRAGETVVHVTSELTNAEGKIIAKSTANLVKTSFKM